MKLTFGMACSIAVAFATAAAHAAPAIMPAPAPATSAQAQAPQPAAPAKMPKGFRADYAIPVPLLDMMVTLTPDQRTKITAIEAKLKTDVATEKQSGNASAARLLPTLASSAIEAVFTNEQRKAIDGYEPMFFMLNKSMRIGPRQLGAANITPDQLTKLATISDDYNAQRTTIEDTCDQKLAALNAATGVTAKAVLSAVQLASLAPPKGN